MNLRLVALRSIQLVYGVTWSAARSWLESALARCAADPASENTDLKRAQARTLLSLGGVLGNLHQHTEAQARLVESLRLFEELGDLAWSAFTLDRLGWLAREQGNVAAARRYLERSLALNRELGDKSGMVSAAITLGEVLVMQEEAESAAALLAEGLALSRELNESGGIAWAFNHLGHVAQLQGDYERARRLHEESLAIFRGLEIYEIGIVWAEQGLGETALAEGDPARARAYLADALRVMHSWGEDSVPDLAAMSWCLAGLAGVAALDEEPERAARLWGAAEALRQSIGAREAPVARATHERLQAAVHEQLGEAAFDAAWAEGGALSWEAAVEYALAQSVEGGETAP